MIANPNKFQAIILQIGNKSNNTIITLNIKNITTNTSKSVKLLGIRIDSKINLKEHSSALCKKASLQLNLIHVFFLWETHLFAWASIFLTKYQTLGWDFLNIFLKFDLFIFFSSFLIRFNTNSKHHFLDNGDKKE